MNGAIKYAIIGAVALLAGACFGGGGSNDVSDIEEVQIEEPKRLYGIIEEGYTIERSTIKQGELMGSIFGRHGLSMGKTIEMEKIAKEVYPLNKIRGGNDYTTFTRQDSLGSHLDYLVYDLDKSHYVVYAFAGDSLSVYKEERPTTIKRCKREATIDSSMWGAIMEAEMPYALGAEIENIYQWTVDFFAIRKGDNFTVIYDEIFVDDSVSIGLGQVWGAKFEHAGKEYYAIPFKQNENLQYWEEDGGSLRKQMLKAPLKYSRISSGFSYSRLHPIDKVYRPHTGVDYAAPMGTPVHSVADGVVTFKGWGGGGGNTLKIQHAGGFVTGYLHLKSYASGVYSGAKIKQGQTIGYVGSTGSSTGPHLDYRIWKGGVPINPLTIPQEPTEPISTGNQRAFNYVKEQIKAELNGDIDDVERITDLDSVMDRINRVDSLNNFISQMQSDYHSRPALTSML